MMIPDNNSGARSTKQSGNHMIDRKEAAVKRICGLMLFCFGAGMALFLFIPENIFTILFIAGCLILGYNLFCC